MPSLYSSTSCSSLGRIWKGPKRPWYTGLLLSKVLAQQRTVLAGNAGLALPNSRATLRAASMVGRVETLQAQ